MTKEPGAIFTSDGHWGQSLMSCCASAFQQAESSNKNATAFARGRRSVSLDVADIAMIRTRPRWPPYTTRTYLPFARSRAFAASTSRSFGGALVSKDASSADAAAATSETARSNAALFAADGAL